MVAKKKVAAKKKVVTKKNPEPKHIPRVVKDAETDNDANNDAIASKDASGAPPKIHAKVASIIVSIGTDDRKRNHADFVAELLKRLKPVPYGQKGIHVTVTGGYYILDGKVCLPTEYDEKKGTFKKGSTPPSWAGGPSKHAAKNTPLQEQIAHDLKTLSKENYDKKYGLGNRKTGGYQEGTITPAQQAIWKEERAAKRKADKEAAEAEEFEWEPEDVLDDEKFTKSSKKSVASASKKLAGGKKRVIKRSKPVEKPAKRVVRRNKK